MAGKLMTWDEFKKDTEKLAATTARLLNSEDGRIVMEVLVKRWVLGDLRGSNPEETYFNLGARAMVLHLQNLVELGKPKDTDAK